MVSSCVQLSLEQYRAALLLDLVAQVTLQRCSVEEELHNFWVTVNEPARAASSNPLQ